MDVTQEAIISLILEEGGKVKNSDLINRFKGSLNCADPVEKQQNRDLFKKFVNTVAVVKEIDGVKYTVLRKKYNNLLQETTTEENEVEKCDNEETLKPDANSENNSPRPSQDTGGEGASFRAKNPPPMASGIGESGLNGDEANSPAPTCSPIELALQRTTTAEFKPKRALHFHFTPSSDGEKPVSKDLRVGHTNATPAHSKPYALPLRMPPNPTKVEIHKLKGDSSEKPKLDPVDSPRTARKKRPSSGEGAGPNSPLPRRSVKSTKPSSSPEDPKENRFPSSTCPLDQAEHELLVKSAAGHWKQVYGLLLRDNQLAEKRDFMSGFTALHWAVKWGNSDMVGKILNISGAEVDVDAKTHGGYTPLHIAALHDQEFILVMLVKHYGADVNVRDNCGKRPYHYLHKGVSEPVRELLGQPKSQQAHRVEEPPAHNDKEELDLFPELSKGLHTISRLFQPHVPGHKKKHKQRGGFYSLSEDPREEREESAFKSRVLSEIFM
ncbi:ankyrin repeat domain-containing protein SOWAHA [Aplochiton taeniatus]